MNHQSLLSCDAKDYLFTFYGILDRMIEGMTEAELTDSISHNFIVQMIPHHQAAIEMSRKLLQYTSCVPLQRIAEHIMEEQTESIENMKAILDTCGCLTNSERSVFLYQRRMKQIMCKMFSQMENAPVSDRINCAFMWEMIPHHQGALEMSANALQFHICDELCPVIEAIVTSQRRGIMQMQRLLKTLCC